MSTHSCPTCGNNFSVPDWLDGSAECPHCSGGSASTGSVAPAESQPIQPTAVGAPATSGHAPSQLPSNDLAMILRQTKPWVRFMSVLAYIGIGLMILGSIVLFVLVGAGMFSSDMGPAELVGVAVGYLIGALLYFFPAYYLGCYASNIQGYLTNPSQDHLAKALLSQKSFWKYVGVLSLVVLIVYGVLMIVALVMGIVSSL